MFGATQLCTNYYKNLENKLGKVSEKQSGTGYDIIKCYPRVVNKTHIWRVSPQKMCEIVFASQKDWIQNLALEVKNAMNFITVIEQEFLKSFSRQKKTWKTM